MSERAKRTLIVVGGHEDKKNEKVILGEVARRVGDERLVVCTAATKEPDESFQEYDKVFRGLGIKHIWHLNVKTREEAKQEKKWRVLEGAKCVFFTGGDQLEITSQLGDTPCFNLIRQIYEDGGIIAGTSAGASVMCETMMVAGGSQDSHRLGETIKLASGFGLINGVIIDQHFAERGRVGRLVAVIAQNPKNIGLGIDEDTAIIVENDKEFYVLGSGAVYVIDGTDLSNSNITEGNPDETLAVYDMKIHLLSQGHSFDLQKRRPALLSKRQIAEKLPPGNSNGKKASRKDAA